MADSLGDLDMLDSAASERLIPGANPDRMARWGGTLLLATALVTAVMVYARVASGTDQATMLESLRAVAENRELYALFGGARLVSGLTLLAAGWLLLRTWIIRDRWATPWVPYLFIASGVCTGISGASALVVMTQADLQIAPAADLGGIRAVVNLTVIAGKVGFTLAGLALILAAWFQRQVGGTLRKVAPASAVLGIAMQLIWWGAATVIHPIVGGIFFLWLLVIGTMLATGRVERHFVARYGAEAC